MLDVAIIGGGLSGLSLAIELQARGLQYALYEARERFGGRILSHNPCDQDASYRFDLGPSWIWPDYQPRLSAFLGRHGIVAYPQWDRGNSLYLSEREGLPQAYVDRTTYADARRIHGGSYRLIEVLLKSLRRETLYGGHQLVEVKDQLGHIELLFNTGEGSLTVQARRVVLTLPPRLLINTIRFRPGLDAKLADVMRDTPTWMAGHAKAVLCYRHPFWREVSLSGNAFSTYPGAALTEIYDACSPDGKFAGLSGFFALPAELRRTYRGDLEALIIEQLVRLFGKEAATPETIVIKDWCEEPYTATAADQVPPATHPAYGHPWLQLDHWNDKLFFSGTETAPQFGGYLEGALEATERVVKSLLLSELESVGGEG